AAGPSFFAIEDFVSAEDQRALEIGSWGRARSAFRKVTPSPPEGFDHATGWPMLAGWYGVEYRSAPAAGVAGPPAYLPSIARGISLNGANLGACQAWQIRALPLAPIWRGFLIDTLFYAGAWMLFAWLTRTLRRARSHRHRIVPSSKP